ncbi:regulator of G-protein signaling 9-like isoform X1 [Lethenteron reissneri]|uniref:regulator of G-protein signaling 9-like isoform X1 n=1 Tax=Lethenteron reissneri TaxID=7753 RepID=UPI002AB6CDC6|nr:regulator of G-protein signaling 9-like isoform X1 [Lethenteron reissneri]
MASSKKVECLVCRMQDKQTGVPLLTRHFITFAIPNAIIGYNIADWMLRDMKITQEETSNLCNLLVKYGYLYPVRPAARLGFHPSKLYHFQTPYFWPDRHREASDVEYAVHLVKKNVLSNGQLAEYEKVQYHQLYRSEHHKWDFVIIQAQEQIRTLQERRKGDRAVLVSQEQAYWRVARPPPGLDNDALNGPVKHTMALHREQVAELYKNQIVYGRRALGRARLKPSVSLEGLLKYSEQFIPLDPVLSGCLPNNPWMSDDTTYWVLNDTMVEVPLRLRVERWSFSFQELIQDLRGRKEFKEFLCMEFSGENLSFWEACEDLLYGDCTRVHAKVEQIYTDFLAPWAKRCINIDAKTMAVTLEGLKSPHRYVLEAAQTHIYMLMKKDSYPRYLKSDLYKSMLAGAIVLSAGNAHSH